jgi:hypothetical protein
MGSGRWTADSWTTYTSHSHVNVDGTSKGLDEIISSRGLNKELDPRGIVLRESCDSKDNPNSTAIITALDVTGSMMSVVDAMARTGMNTLCTEIYNRKPVTDPHILCMGIGDVEYDQAPLQVTQFEADIRIAQQLELLYLEKGGGGNSYESYSLAYWFAAMHTKIDCFEKRGKKGYIFTMGDERPTPILRKRNMERHGLAIQGDLKLQDLLTLASRQWEIFHVVVEQGSNGRDPGVLSEWQEYLGQRVLRLSDHTKIAEVIVSAIQVNEGTDREAVVKSWDGSTSVVVKNALNTLTASKGKTSSGVVTL